MYPKTSEKHHGSFYESRLAIKAGHPIPNHFNRHHALDVQAEGAT